MFTRKRGSALISAMFTMTLVAMVATAMHARLQTDIYRTQLAINQDRIVLASQGMVFWAMGQLRKPALSNLNTTVSVFPTQARYDYPGLSMQGYLEDEQSFFNLNNLIDERYQPIFLNLLKNVLPDLSANTRLALAKAIKARIYPADKSRQLWRQNLTSHFLPDVIKQNLLQNLQELKTITGFSAQRFDALKPYIVVLPAITPINLNSASKIVLSSLGQGLSDNKIEALLRFKTKKGFDLAKIRPFLLKEHIDIHSITLVSEFYLNKATLSNDETNLTLFTLLKRQQLPHEPIGVSLIKQSYQPF
tara:strand:- start:74 stop:988 length:915 start_codon:yes stop_codon:yes gene_type:complete